MSVALDAHCVALPSTAASLASGQCVRIVGSLRSFDLTTFTMVLAHRGNHVRVRAALLGPIPIRRGDIWTILGEVVREKGDDGSVVIEARAGRQTPNVDLALVERCIAARATYITRLLQQP